MMAAATVEHTRLVCSALDRAVRAPEDRDDARDEEQRPEVQGGDSGDASSRGRRSESFRQNPSAPQRLNAFALVTG